MRELGGVYESPKIESFVYSLSLSRRRTQTLQSFSALSPSKVNRSGACPGEDRVKVKQRGEHFISLSAEIRLVNQQCFNQTSQVSN